MRSVTRKSGFMATTAVVMLAMGVFAYSLAVQAAALQYADMVDRHERRIRASINTIACLDHIFLMATRDYFLLGPISVAEFSCEAVVSNDFSGGFTISVVSREGDIAASSTTTLFIK